MMFNKLLSRKNSVIHKWFISYVVVFLIPILISVFVYGYMQSSLREQIKNTNQLVLNQLIREFDNIVMDMVGVGDQLELNKTIRSYAFSSTEKENLKLLSLNEISGELKIFGKNTDAHCLYLYCSDMDMVVTSSGVYPSKYFYSTYVGSDMSYEGWKKILSQKHYSELELLQFQFNEDTSTDGIAYIKTLPADAANGNYITMCMMYDMTDFRNKVKNSKLIDNGIMFAIDKNNTRIPIVNNTANEIELEELQSQEISNDKFVVSDTPSSLMNLKYVSIMPCDTVDSQMKYIMWIIIVSIIVVIIIGSFVIFYLVRKNYKPIVNLFSALKLKYTGEENEFSFLNDIIDKTVSENREISSKLEEQQQIVQSSFLRRLLIGGVDYDAPIEEILSNMNICMPYSKYVLLMYYVDSYGDFFEGANSLNEYKRIERIDFVFKNIVGELLGEHFKHVSFNDETVTYFLFNFENRKDTPKIYELAKKSQKIIFDNFNIQFTIAVSDIHDSYRGIAEAYQEVLEAIKYRSPASGEFIAFEDIRQEDNKYKYYESMDEENLIRVIKSGDAACAIDIIQSNLALDTYSLKGRRRVIYDIIKILIKLIDEAMPEGYSNLALRDSLIEVLFENKSVAEMEQIVYAAIEDLVQFFDNDDNNNIVREIEKFVNDNYMNPNMNIAMIGEHFCLSPAYMSKLYKQGKGIGLLDYMNKTRIEHAKLLLQESRMNLEDIAIQVGFANKITFMRVFKKYMRMTPGKYREVHRLE
ncbi:MAG: helix-turn-helix transcriptional regulator [Clostridia bacterium]|nr:helix-turn-helix transcriptional regulator [Clostridia bacterium]